jgi:hypothetical protein
MFNSAKNIASKIADAITPDNQIEYITFKKIKGSAIKDRIAGGQEAFAKGDVTQLKLKINPQSIKYKQKKIISTVQTNSPNRFVIFDWGNDLLQITIDGCTGNLLPAEITSGFNPVKSAMNDLSMIDSDFGNDAANFMNNGADNSLVAGATGMFGVGNIAPVLQNMMIGTQTYYQLLEQSPKYRIFQELYSLYRESDIDKDIVILETGNAVYRGFFVDFSFDQTAESPWNWKYSITFSSLQNLNDFYQRYDSKYNTALLQKG